MQQHLLRFCHVSGCFLAAGFSGGRDMYHLDPLVGSVSERLHKAFLRQAGDDSRNRRLSDAKFLFQLLPGALLLLGFLRLHQNRNLHHGQVFPSQGVIRLFFQPVMQQFDKPSAGNCIRHTTDFF